MNEKDKPLFADSGLKFVTSEGADLSIGPSVGAAVASAGSIYVDSKTDSNRYKLNYGGGGVSLSLGPLVGFDFATADMFSDGVIYANTLRNESVAIGDISGPCLVYQGQFSPGLVAAGASATIMFLNVGLGLVAGWIAFCSGWGAPLAPAIVISSCRAIVIYWSKNYGTPGVGVSGTLGWLSVGDARVMKKSFENLAESFLKKQK